MSSLVFIKPLTLAAIATAGGGPVGPTYANTSRLVTPDPKEAFTFPASGTGYSFDVDLGSAQSADSFFVGYHNATAAGQTITVQTIASMGGAATATAQATYALPPLGTAPPSHSFVRALAATTGRYWRFGIQNPAGNADLTIGVLALGLALQPTFGHEWGAGRRVIDTGNKDRLLSGSFGVNPGAKAGAWAWTCGDLTDAEVDALYGLALALGETGTLLVVEDPDQTAGLSRRCHWTTFTGLEAYERLIPGTSRWAFKVEDWA